VTGTDFQQTPEKAAKAAFFMSGERRGHGIVQKLNPNRDKHKMLVKATSIAGR
jgi:hypothetical protein